MSIDQLEIAKKYDNIIENNSWDAQLTADSEEKSQVVEQNKKLIEKPKE